VDVRPTCLAQGRLYKHTPIHIMAVVELAVPDRPTMVGTVAPGQWPDGARSRNPRREAAAAAQTRSSPAIWPMDLAYGGITVHDVTTQRAPRSESLLVSAIARGTHTALATRPDRNLWSFADEPQTHDCANGVPAHLDGDVSSSRNPVPSSTFPRALGARLLRKGGTFGPHNRHENGPARSRAPTSSSSTFREGRP